VDLGPFEPLKIERMAMGRPSDQETLDKAIDLVVIEG
jgi:hypothetical protein